MLNRFLALLLTGSSFALALSGCRHDQDKGDVPNPCATAAANPLSFQFLEYSGTPTPDTTYNSQLVTFAGPGAPYTAYEWLVGPTTRRTTQQFGLYFDEKTVGTVPVRLIARRPPNTACFAHDDGVDTLTKVLTLVPFVDPYVPLRNPRAPIYGTFHGANRSTPRDTFTVWIHQGVNYDYPTDPTAPPTDYVRNIPKGCKLPFFDNYLGWRGVHMNLGGCTGLQGSGYVIGRDSIRITYHTRPQSALVDEVFLGKRVR